VDDPVDLNKYFSRGAPRAKPALRDWTAVPGLSVQLSLANLYKVVHYLLDKLSLKDTLYLIYFYTWAKRCDARVCYMT
jgi:hypothetical protein